jgi:hypothetical protein
MVTCNQRAEFGLPLKLLAFLIITLQNPLLLKAIHRWRMGFVLHHPEPVA